MNHEYKNVVFTDHSLERLKLRRITQDMVISTLKKPDSQAPEEDGDIKFVKIIQDRQVQVVSRYLPDEKKWLVISAWVRGEEDPQPVWKRVFSWLIKQVRSGFNTSKNNGQRSRKSSRSRR